MKSKCFCSWLLISVMGISLLAAAPAALAAPKNKLPVPVTVPWDGKNLTARHPVVNGLETTLKGVATDADGTVDFFQWNFGDGNVGPKTAVTDPLFIEGTHTYNLAAGTDVDAVLTVWDNKAATATAVYKITVMGDTLETRNSAAIDAALWWIHKNIVRYNFQDDPAKPCGYIENGGWNPGMVTDSFALQGLEEQGHLPSNPPSGDPYVDDARRLLNEISRWIFVTPSKTKGDGSAEFPELTCDSNGDGLMMGTLEDHYEYEMGPVLKAIVNSGMGAAFPTVYDDSLNVTGDPAKSVSLFTYNQIAQNMIDYISWAQLYQHPNDYSAWDATGFVGPSKVDTVALNPVCRGSWPYWAEGWNDPLTGERAGWGDIAIGFWTVTGLNAAEDRGLTVPPFVKEELGRFVSPENGRQNLNPMDENYGEVYFGPNDGYYGAVNYHLIERASELLVVLEYLGVPQTEVRADAALSFIRNSWNKHNFDTGQSHPRPRDPYADSYSVFKTGPTYWWSEWFYNDTPGFNYSFFHTYEANPATGEILWGWEEGDFVDGVWTPVKQGDDLNIFALYALSRAMKNYGITDFPGAGIDPDGLDWEGRVQKLLSHNQLRDGGFDEQNWVYGSPFGTPWALMTMMEKAPAAGGDPTMKVASINMSIRLKSGVEYLDTVVKVADAVGNPVVGASVTGTLDRDGAALQSNVSGTTDALGNVTFTYYVKKSLLPAGTYTFSVTNVALSGMVWTDTPPVTGQLVKE